MHTALAGNPMAAADRADELRRLRGRVHELALQVEAAVALIPQPGTVDAWWGPAREAVQGSFDLERERLRREVLRLHGVADQLHVAELVVRDSLIVGSDPGGVP